MPHGALMTPALAWAAFRKRQGVAPSRLAWTWDLAGAILVTVLVLGPLQKIQGFHPVAPIALAVGLGVKFRRWAVWKSLAWERGAFRAAGIVVLMLPGYVVWQFHREASVTEQIWSMPGGSSEPDLDRSGHLVRPDHTSLHGYVPRRRPSSRGGRSWE